MARAKIRAIVLKEILRNQDKVREMPYLLPAHLFEQYLTFSQFFSHFFLQVKGRLQTGHILVGRCSFFIEI